MRSIRLLIVLAISIIQIVLSDKDVSHRARDFFSSYLGIIKGHEFSMDVDCFSGKFDKLFEDLINAAESLNLIKVVRNIGDIVELEIAKCPVKEMEEIWQDFRTASRNGTIIKNFLKNSGLIEHNIKTFLESDKSACSLGKLAGSLVKIATYGVGHTSWVEPHQHNPETNLLKFLQ